MAAYFDKTEKGREEIATRKYQLGLRLRSLLLVIDGKHSADDILGKFQGSGLGEQSLAELLEQGFIKSVANELPQAAKDSSASGAGPSVGGNQYKSLYQFYTETIKSTLGLRGYALQLKVERAGSVADFRELRDPYLKAVEKAKGQEMVHSLRDRLDKLLENDDGMPARESPIS